MRMETGNQVILPELSYLITGATFKVFNSLGWGFQEKDYQKALARELEKSNVAFREQVYIPISYEGKLLSKYYADFIVEDKILLELKVVTKLGYSQARQILNYLRGAKIKLGILLYFSEEGVKYRRVLNSHY